MALNSKEVYNINSFEVKQEILTNEESEQVKAEQEVDKESSLLCVSSLNMDNNFEQQTKDDVAELYAGHIVKVELVIGPEILQQPDAAATSEETDTGPLLETATINFYSEVAVDKSYGSLNGSPHYTCQKELKSKKTLELHLKQEESSLSCDSRNNNPFTCSICQKQLSSKRSLHLHILKHEQSPFSCGICGAKRKSSLTLKSHIVRMHNNQCTICTKHCKNKRLLQAHMLRHYDEKPFSCSICQKKFGVRDDLRRHLHRHTEETPYSCNICENKFKTKQTLEVHSIRVHATDRPHKCSDCNKCFVRHYELKRHMQTHTGEKPFSCPLCPKKFVHGSSLKEHTVKRHSKDFPYN